jgi:peptide/nickel transport system permease protein
MLRYILRRIGMMIPVILGVLLIVFTTTRLSGDPVAAILGPGASAEDYENERHVLGLDQPYPVQFFNYVKGVVTKLDLGTSYSTQRPVSEEVVKRLPISLSMAMISLVISTFIGVIFGVICATHQNHKVDYIVTLLSLLVGSLPNFWFALMLILFFSVSLGWLPATGLDNWACWIMPCLALGLSPIANLCRTTRSSMLEEIRQDYIRTARSKGISNRRVIFKHALKNALFPVITVFGLMASVNIGGQVVIETVFTIPGIGSYMMESITNRDYPALQGTVLVLSLLVCIINLLVDIGYGFADPRIRAKYSQRKTKTVAEGPLPLKEAHQ